MENKYELLLKPYWDTIDIQEYFGVGETKALKIKASVASNYGVIPCELPQDRARVSADSVIKSMGGQSRLEELQIYKTYKEIKNG